MMRSAFGALVLLATACSTQPAGFEAPQLGNVIRPELKLHATCPVAAVGQTSDGTLSIINQADTATLIERIDVPTGAPLTAVFAGPKELRALRELLVPLRCQPFAPGVTEQGIVIQTNRGSARTTVQLKGRAPRALVLPPAKPSVVPFVTGKSFASILTVPLLNLGNEPLHLIAPPGGTAQADFNWQKVVIAPGDMTRLRFRVRPSSVGALSRSVRLYTDDPARPPLQFELHALAEERAPCVVRVDRFSATDGAATVVRLTNLGTTAQATCDLSGVDLGDDIDADAISTKGDWARVGPGDSVDLRITLAAIPFASPELRFHGPADTQQPARIPVFGAGAVDCVQVSLAAINFGERGFGCGAVTRTVTAYNSCASAAFIAPELQGSPFDLSLDHPVVVPPGGSTTFNVTYAVGSAGVHSNSLRLVVAHGGRQAPLMVSLTGTTRAPVMKTDEFNGARSGTFDVVFVIAAPDLFADKRPFNQAGWADGEYYLPTCAATVRSVVLQAGDGGVFVAASDGGSEVVTAGMSTFWPELTARVHEAATNAGTDALATLDNALPALLDAGFTRPDTDIIIISNGPETSADSVVGYVSRLRETWPRVSLTTVSPRRQDPLCSRQPADGRLATFATLLNGYAADYCTDIWFPYTTTFGGGSCGMQGPHLLSAVPAPSSAVVTIDGVPAPAVDSRGSVLWRIDPVLNALIFEPQSIPDPDQLLNVTYAQTCVP